MVQIHLLAPEFMCFPLCASIGLEVLGKLRLSGLIAGYCTPPTASSVGRESVVVFRLALDVIPTSRMKSAATVSIAGLVVVQSHDNRALTGPRCQFNKARLGGLYHLHQWPAIPATTSTTRYCARLRKPLTHCSHW